MKNEFPIRVGNEEAVEGYASKLTEGQEQALSKGPQESDAECSKGWQKKQPTPMLNGSPDKL